jgi:hypothetical protein
MTRRWFAVALAAALAPAAAAAQISFEPEVPAPAVSTAAPQSAAPASPVAVDDGWTHPVLSFRLVTRLYLSTTFEGADTNVLDFYRFATASVRVSKGSLRVLVTARLRWVTYEQRPTSGAFNLFNGANPRSELEPTLGETSISGTNSGIDWSVGLLDIVWGENPAFSPADVLVPLNMRDGLMPGPDQRIPVPAVRVRGPLGPLQWDAVYLPLFVPSQLPLLGNNWSPYAVVTNPVIPNLQNYVDPTTYATLTNTLMASKYPQNDLSSPQGGLRVTAHPGPLTVSASWAEFFDRQPMVAVSSSFQQFIAATQSGNELNTDLAALAFQSSLQNGVAPLTATFQRTRVFALDAALPTGPVRWTLDAGYSPLRVFPLMNLTTIVKPMLSGALGLEWEGPPVIAAGVYGLAAFNVRPGERLLYIDTNATNVSLNRNPWFAVGYLAVRDTFVNDKLEVSLSGVVTFGGDAYATPEAHWNITDAHHLGGRVSAKQRRVRRVRADALSRV